MTCDQFWNGELTGLEHLDECRACAARFGQQERLATGLRALAAQMRRVEAPARVERNLIAGFRAQTQLSGVARPAPSWRTLGACAAAILVTAGLAFLVSRPYQPEPAVRLPKTATQLAAVELPAEYAFLEAEDANGFIPLANAAGVASNEPLDVVRLEVPLSTMMALGFTVTAERASERVQADFMLGEDGMARAVRFLN
jgi:hypothetical protein